MLGDVSKAFTKDDGPEAAPILRRRAPLPDGTPNYVTARGLKALRDELAQLDAMPSSSQASAPGAVDGRTAWRSELETRIATAVLAPLPEDRDQVRFGAKVHVQDADGQTRELQLVGVDEADAARGLMAFTAPLARALLGRRVGDVVSVRTPGGEEELTVVRISYDRLA
jgi:transcription elongation factor GreB